MINFDTLEPLRFFSSQYHKKMFFHNLTTNKDSGGTLWQKTEKIKNH